MFQNQNIKSHRLLLSISSCVFAKMLFGHFKEAKLGADEPIPLHGVTSDVFECAMRYYLIFIFLHVLIFIFLKVPLRGGEKFPGC
jgi:BTB/POZ domain